MEIQEIKQKLRITAVLAHYGIQIQKGKQINFAFVGVMRKQYG